MAKGTTPGQRQVGEGGDPELVLLESEKRKVIGKIKKLDFRTTPYELASASDLSISRSPFWLNRIAGETGGRLEVAADGTIYYTFAKNFTDAYLKRGFARAALATGIVLFNILYWIIRLSFGVALVLSLLVIVLIFVALLVMALAAIFDDKGGGGGFDLDLGGFFNLDFLFDLFRFDYSPSHSRYPMSRPSPRREKYSSFVEEHPKGNFFLDCFSFLFGDGAPNSNLEEMRWQQIAMTIKDNGGVVSTEQLAPFLDGDRSDSGMILTALAQFNGRPVVTDSGFIVYVFEDFLAKGAAPKVAASRGMLFLAEDEWKFSALTPETTSFVFILALLNFAGSWWLFKHIATIHLLHELSLVIDILLTYAVVFLAIPLTRLLVIAILNLRVKERNKRRERAYELIAEPAGDVLQELIEARQVKEAEAARVAVDRRIVYSSDKDSLEQQFESQ